GFTRIWAFDKQALLDGTGMNLLWAASTSASTRYPFQSGRLFDGAQLRTPILLQDADGFFVGPGPFYTDPVTFCSSMINTTAIIYGSHAGIGNGGIEILV